MAGQAARQYDFRLTKPGNPNAGRTVSLVVNDETQLLVSMEATYQDSARSVTQYDYPISGPANMYALGIPETARVIDRRASTDVREVASKWMTARTEFDNYDAIFVQYPDKLSHSVTTGLNTTIKRVRRKGNRYRIDTLLKPRFDISEPNVETDMHEWWVENRDRYWSAPELICDGSVVTTYLLKDGRVPKNGKPNLEVKLRQKGGVQGITSDPTVAWPHLMPEYACRPHLWTTIESRQFEYDPASTDGPKGTVRLIVSKPGKTTSERHRYWLDPAKEFVVTKIVQPVFDRKTNDVAYVDTETLSQFKRSPGGFCYPTLAQRTTSTSKHTQIRHYYVDFSVELDDDLFEPLNLKN